MRCAPNSRGARQRRRDAHMKADGELTAQLLRAALASLCACFSTALGCPKKLPASELELLLA